MKISMTTWKAAVATAIVLTAGTALATPTPADKCKASKNKVAGAYYACREKLEAKAVSKGGTPDYSTCTSKFTDKWTDAETEGSTDCPDNVALPASAAAYIAGQATNTAGVLAGNGFPSCGDGVINMVGEHCDGSDLDGHTCASFGFYGTLACTAGCDFNLSGCTTTPAPAVAPAEQASATAVSNGDKCRAGKNKAAGAYYACRKKAEATAISKGLAADYNKCDSKFSEKWNAAEEVGQGTCPDNMTGLDVGNYISGQATEVTEIVAGSTNIPICGDGVVNAAGEQCDGAALDGYTCSSFNMTGTLACTVDCDFNVSGCSTCPPSGITFGGGCWLLGAAAADCNSTCGSFGMVYDDKTKTVAGSAGTDENCVAILDALGTTGDVLDNPGGSCTTGLGCGVNLEYGFRARCGTPDTDATSIFSDVHRACACK